MKQLLFITLIFCLFETNSFAIKKHIFNSKIERESLYNCGNCPCDEKRRKETNGHCWSGSMECCWPIYIYIYPKNIDKMIAENPEFKNEIVIEAEEILLTSNPVNLDGYPNRSIENKVTIKSCYDLWKYNYLDPYGTTTLTMKNLMQFEQHCNQIIKKILKKTGKLY